MDNAAGGRLFLLDGLKAASCVAIVWHHLAFYGPMSDAALPLAPRLIAWLYDYGRIAVQVFLVVSGFLVAAQLAPGAGVPDRPSTGAPQLIARRYLRLVLPLLAALTVALLASAAVRPWLHHDSVPGVPNGPQLLAHGLLLQHLLGIEALSAGIWYVAIDLQLYAVAVLLLLGLRRLPVSADARGRIAVAIVATGVAASLFVWNRQDRLDATALYFWGAYGLGMLAWWTRGRGAGARAAGCVALAVLGLAALAVDFRLRIALALAVALLLASGFTLPAGAAPGAPAAWRRAVSGLARISYSVFLIHFPVSLLVSALVHRLWPAQPVVNALGMAASFGLSLLAGWLLHAGVERRPATWARWLAWEAGFLAVGALLMALPALAR